MTLTPSPAETSVQIEAPRPASAVMVRPVPAASKMASVRPRRALPSEAATNGTPLKSAGASAARAVRG